MTNSELRAAAVIVKAGSGDYSAEAIIKREHAAIVLADAYLAIVPADAAEPITEAWLRSVGGDVRPRSATQSRWLDSMVDFQHDRNCLAVNIAKDGHTSIALIDRFGTPAYLLEAGAVSRQQFRALTVGLGIPLTPAPDGG